LKRAPKIVDSQVGRIWKLKHEKKTFLRGELVGRVLGRELLDRSEKKKNLSGGNFGEGKNKEKKTA
jgi:hypothetical protein